MNKKYLYSTIFWYASILLLITSVIITIVSFSIAALLMIVMCYLSLLFISSYIEIILLGNRRSWLLEVFYIIFIRTPHFVELISVRINTKKSTKITLSMLNIIYDEELPLFIYFTSFLKYYTHKTFGNKIIELAMFDKDANKALLKRMEFLGFQFKVKYTYKNVATSYKVSWGTLTIIIYIINKKRNRFIRCSFDPNSIQIYSEYALKLKEYSIKKTKFMGPDFATQYLRHYYGKDWRITFPNFNLFSGPRLSIAEKSLQSNYVNKINYL